MSGSAAGRGSGQTAILTVAKGAEVTILLSAFGVDWAQQQYVKHKFPGGTSYEDAYMEGTVMAKGQAHKYVDGNRWRVAWTNPAGMGTDIVAEASLTVTKAAEVRATRKRPSSLATASSSKSKKKPPPKLPRKATDVQQAAAARASAVGTGETKKAKRSRTSSAVNVDGVDPGYASDDNLPPVEPQQESEEKDTRNSVRNVKFAEGAVMQDMGPLQIRPDVLANVSMTDASTMTELAWLTIWFNVGEVFARAVIQSNNYIAHNNLQITPVGLGEIYIFHALLLVIFSTKGGTREMITGTSPAR